MSHIETIRSWLTDRALPLWSSCGVDHAEGGFVERLTMTGEPDLTATKRVRVQARQVYVFSHAYLIGMCPKGRELAMHGIEFIKDHAWIPDGGGVVHSLDRSGNVIDSKRDTYDHAFVLYALAWAYRATQDRTVLKLMQDLSLAIDTNLQHPDGQSLLEDDQGGKPRRQNPHMHAFEAYIAAFSATGDRTFVEKGQAIFHLCRDYFVAPKTGALREYFNSNWNPLDGGEENIIEPGHHYEWIWLLHRFEQISGIDTAPLANQLRFFVSASGQENDTGLVFDEVWESGLPKKKSKRSWPQTEALKAELALCELKKIPVTDHADKIVDNLFSYYLNIGCPGGWNDQLDENNIAVSEFMPASTFYHVFLAFAEYLRVAASLDVKTNA